MDPTPTLTLAMYVMIPNKSIAKLLSATMTAALIKGSGLLVSFVFLAVVARQMSPENYGFFASMYSVAIFSGMALNFGQEQIILRFNQFGAEKKASSRMASLLISSFAFVIVGAGIIWLFLLAGTVTWTASGKQLDFVAVSVTFAVGISLAFAHSMAAAFRMRGEIVTGIGPRDVVWRLLAVVLILGFGLTEPVGTMLTLLAILSLLVLMQLIGLFQGAEFSKLEFPVGKLLLERMSRSFWFWGNTVLAEDLVLAAIVIFIGWTFGPVEAGAYFACSRISRLLSISVMATNQLLGPMVSGAFKNGEVGKCRQLLIWANVMSGVIAFVGAGSLVVLGPQLLKLFDQAYTDYTHILYILVVGQLVHGCLGASQIVLLMSDNEVPVLIIKLAGTIVSLVANYCLYVFFGLAGIAAGSSIFFIIIFGGLTLLASNRLNQPVAEHTK